MTKSEFLDILRSSLGSELPGDKVNENLNYYDDYIDQSLAKGKNYDEIFEELGDPRLIARTIIDTYKMQKGYQYKHEPQSGNYENNSYGNSGSNDGYNRENHDESKNWSVKFGSSIPWYQKLLGILLVILVIAAIVALSGIAIHLFFSIVVPILFVYFFIKFIINIFNHRY